MAERDLVDVDEEGHGRGYSLPIQAGDLVHFICYRTHLVEYKKAQLTQREARDSLGI